VVTGHRPWFYAAALLKASLSRRIERADNLEVWA
jgi:hypothetical protein